MLAYILALVVGLGSLAIYIAAFFFPEVHRKSDFIWSGVGLFYALVLWACAGRITGALLLGQTASVALVGWFAWQTLTLRRQVTPASQQTPMPASGPIPEVGGGSKGWSGGLFKRSGAKKPKPVPSVTAVTPPAEVAPAPEPEQPQESEPETVSEITSPQEASPAPLIPELETPASPAPESSIPEPEPVATPAPTPVMETPMVEIGFESLVEAKPSDLEEKSDPESEIATPPKTPAAVKPKASKKSGGIFGFLTNLPKTLGFGKSKASPAPVSAPETPTPKGDVVESVGLDDDDDWLAEDQQTSVSPEVSEKQTEPSVPAPESEASLETPEVATEIEATPVSEVMVESEVSSLEPDLGVPGEPETESEPEPEISGDGEAVEPIEGSDVSEPVDTVSAEIAEIPTETAPEIEESAESESEENWVTADTLTPEAEDSEAPQTETEEDANLSNKGFQPKKKNKNKPK